MINKGLIITNAFALWSETKLMIERLRIEFAVFKITLDHKQNDEIVAYIDQDGNAKSTLPAYDFIIYLDKDYYIASLLEKCGYRLFNSAEAVHNCDDKMLTHLRLTNNGIKMPTTINYPLRYSQESHDMFLKHVKNILQLPLIVKHVYGSLGEQVYLINTDQELLQIAEKLKYVPHIYQEYIQSSFGKDLRIVLVNNVIVASMQRVAQKQGEFRSNIETGGIGLIVDIPPAFAQMAIKTSECLKMDYCGLDILYGIGGEPVLLEVNANAYFSPIEKYSKQNVAAPYVKHIIRTIYG